MKSLILLAEIIFFYFLKNYHSMKNYVQFDSIEKDGAAQCIVGKSTKFLRREINMAEKIKGINMPFRCAVAGCSHQSRFQKTLVFYSFSKDEKLWRKWIRAIALRRKNYQWKSSDRVCRAHFPGGHKYGNNNIPSIFPRLDPKTSEIVWPVDILPLLKETRH